MKREYRSFKFLLFFVIKGALPLFVGWMTLCLESFIKISEHKATGTGVTQCQRSRHFDPHLHHLFKDEILLCLLVAAVIAVMILQLRNVRAIRGNRPGIIG